MEVRMTKILCDTRQKAGKHNNIDCWFDRHNVEYEYRALPFGDYITDDESSNRSIDTKRSIAEVAMDVGRDHKRFARELDRAAAAGCRLVVLVEVAGTYHELEDVCRWTAVPCARCELRRMAACDPRGSMRCARFRSKPMQGPTVYRIMRALERDHGCRFELVHPAHSAQRICELLGVTWT